MLRDPKITTPADIYRLIEGPIALLPCASLNYYERCTDCPSEDSYQVHHAVVQIRNESLKILEKSLVRRIFKK